MKIRTTKLEAMAKETTRHPERSAAESKDTAVLPIGMATGFDSLTSRSLSLRPSRPSRGFPNRAILDGARNNGWEFH